MNQVILFAFRNKLVDFESKCRFRNKLLADETQYSNKSCFEKLL